MTRRTGVLRRASWLVAGTLAGVCALLLGPAHAEPTPLPVRLDITRGPGTERCPRDSIFADSAASETSVNPFGPEGRGRVAVTLRRVGRLYQATAELFDDKGASVWTLPLPPIRDCFTLLDGLGFAVALKLEPPHAPDPVVPVPPVAPAPPVVPPPSAPHREAPAPPVVAAPVSPPTTRAPSPTRRPAVPVGVAAVLGFGGEPGPAGGVAIDVGVRWPLVSLAAEGRGDFSSGASRVSAWRGGGALVPCGHWGVVFGCAVASLGQLHAQGTAQHPLPATLFEAAAGGRLGVELPFGKILAVRLSAEALGRLQRASLVINQATQWALPPSSETLAVGLMKSF